MADDRPRGGTPTDHDVAGNVCGIDFEELSNWQLAALAEEAIEALLLRCSRTHPTYQKHCADGIKLARKLRHFWD